MKKISISHIFIFFICLLINSNPCITADTRITGVQKQIECLATKFDMNSMHEVEIIQQIVHFLYDFDQMVRHEFIQDLHVPAVQTLIENMDKEITRWVKKIIEIHGWTVLSKFGKQTDQQMWLLVQHADHDPLFQAAIAFLLEQLVPLNETDIKNFAYLYDRVAVKFQHLGLKQRYGTQVDSSLELFPYEGTEQELDQRRAQVDLEPISEYLKKLQFYYKKARLP